ncbi:ABC transporter substrate-binding protein [Cohnella abietis]|uniref:ABC transporter substrate-binding protein n=1 Tax=Cohnella abietis TaxID=2507935 RepID=A0A3T1CZF0_9BACL|nr:ABC transporter substrate-binding protein [Cohnella abietis]BBI31216.1 ABC transporter substrate-binding protein [Cohnella abietis]
MKRASLLLMSLMLVLTLALTGCGSNKAAEPTEKSNESATAPTDSKKKLTLWFYFEGKSQFDIIKSLTDGFTQKNPNIEIKPVYIPFADFKKRLSVGLAASDLPDIVIIDNPDHAAYTAMGLFADITDKLADWPDKDQYFEGPWKSASYEGKQYGIPLGSNNLALYYNEKMLADANVKPPQTWDELRVAAKALTKGNVKGLGISAPQNEEGTFQFLPWLLSTGATFDHIVPDGTRALGMLSDLIKDGSMSKEVINWTQSDVMKQFASGNLAMMVNGPWQIPDLTKTAPDLKFGIAFVPKDSKFASVLGGENLGVMNGANVDEAVQFIKYVATPEVSKKFSQDFGYFPARRDVASDPYWSQNPQLKVFAENMENAQPRGPHPQWPTISNAISEALSKALTLTTTPEQAATEAQAKIDKILSNK